MGRKKATPMTSWCILRNNQTLRQLIKRRMGEQNLSIQALSEKAGVRYEDIRRYLTEESVKTINHYKLMMVCQILGIQVSLNIEVTRA